MCLKYLEGKIISNVVTVVLQILAFTAVDALKIYCIRNQSHLLNKVDSGYLSEELICVQIGKWEQEKVME